MTQDQRAAFEAWTGYSEEALSRDAGDGYCIKGVDNEWKAWQAAIAHDRKQRGEPQAPSSFVNAAGIHASDGYATVIRKLDAAFHAAVTFRDAAPTIKDSLTVAGAAKVPGHD